MGRGASRNGAGTTFAAYELYLKPHRRPIEWMCAVKRGESLHDLRHQVVFPQREKVRLRTPPQVCRRSSPTTGE